MLFFQDVVLITYTLIFGFILYIFCLSDVDCDGINGTISRYLFWKFPDQMSKTLQMICGDYISKKLSNLCKYVVYDRNPILQVVYLIIINSLYIGWLVFGQHLLPTMLVDYYHAYLATVGMILCHISFYFACTTNPGVINNENVECYMHHPYDNIMFTEGNICKTCEVKRPARSKHCSLCGVCVSKFDHHCVWINQCVGENNYHYFLTFLLVHVLFLFWAGTMIFLVLISEVYEKNLYSQVFINSRTGVELKATPFMIFKYIISRKTNLCIVDIFIFIMGFCLTGFLCYHLYLISQGTTTNESFKWSRVLRVYKDMVVRYKKYVEFNGESAILANKNLSVQKEEKKKLEIDYSADSVGCIPQIVTNGVSDSINNEKVLEEDDEEEVPLNPGGNPVNIYRIGFLNSLWNVFNPKSIILLNSLKDKQIKNNNNKKSKKND
jgi:palmitoyltransferase